MSHLHPVCHPFDYGLWPADVCQCCHSSFLYDRGPMYNQSHLYNNRPYSQYMFNDDNLVEPIDQKSPAEETQASWSNFDGEVIGLWSQYQAPCMRGEEEKSNKPSRKRKQPGSSVTKSQEPHYPSSTFVESEYLLEDLGRQNPFKYPQSMMVQIGHKTKPVSSRLISHFVAPTLRKSYHHVDQPIRPPIISNKQEKVSEYAQKALNQGNDPHVHVIQQRNFTNRHPSVANQRFDKEHRPQITLRRSPVAVHRPSNRINVRQMYDQPSSPNLLYQTSDEYGEKERKEEPKFHGPFRCCQGNHDVIYTVSGEEIPFSRIYSAQTGIDCEETPILW